MSAEPAKTPADMPGIRVWDWPVRVVHWALVVLVPAAWATAEADIKYMQWHLPIGYTVLGLVLFRLAWGFVGPRHARFGSFLTGPRTIWRYARTVPHRTTVPHAGHNPLGGWMVIVLLLLLALQAVTGLFATDDILNQGPWYGAVGSDTAKTLTSLHKSNFDWILAAVGLHVAAVVYYWLWKGSDLIRAMVTGRKRLPAPLQCEAIAGSRTALAIALAALAAGAVWLIVETAPPPPAMDFF